MCSHERASGRRSGTSAAACHARDPVRLAACVAGALCALFASSSASPAQEPPDVEEAVEAEEDTVPAGPEVEAIRFPGAEALDPELIQGAIATRATECRSPFLFVFCLIGDWDWAERKAYLDEAELPEDEDRIELLYEVWGYPDAVAEARVIPEAADAVVVEFRIDEGEPILVESIEVVGLDRLTPPVDLPEPLPLQVGEPYALPRLAATQERIRAAFAERARPYAAIEVGGDVDEAAYTASVILDVEPGPAAVFGPIVVETEPPIDEDVVRERIAYEPGEPYRPSALEETERALFRLLIVASASADPVAAAERDTVIETRVVVAARDPQGFQVEGSISSTECIEVAGFWSHRYFLGRPRIFSLGVGFSNLLAAQTDGGFPCTSAGEDEFAVLNYFVEAELRQPWPGSPRTQALAAVYASRESAPNAFVQTGYGARLGVARELRPRLTATLLYEPARNELDAAGLFFCGNYGLCSAEGIEELSELNWLSPVELLVARAPLGGFGTLRRPDRPLPPWELEALPSRRWWLRAGLEGAHALTGSDFDYARTVGEAALTRTLGTRFEVAGRTRVGLIAGGEALPPQIRLYSGGVNTVRGVSQNLLGPVVLATSPENALALGCEIVVGGCPPGLVIDDDEDLVSVRPLGGDAVLEANVEGRVWLTETIQAAAFVDFGAIGRGFLGAEEDVPFVTDDWDALITPGVGVRVLTGLGPIRVDVGYDASDVDEEPLFTEDPETGALVPLGRVGFEPFEGGFFGELWDRLQLHVAIGQPF